MKAWQKAYSMPVKGRSHKPRGIGYTMILDQGMGLRQIEDLVEVGGEYVDNVQLTYGTCVFYDVKILREKNELLKEHGIERTPGGAFLQVAAIQKTVNEFLKEARRLEFSSVELYDWTTQMPQEERSEIIRKALDGGFKVITEVSPQDGQKGNSMYSIGQQIREDISSGASKVIIPQACLGDVLRHTMASFDIREDHVLWEPPRDAEQQGWIEKLILELGPNVNLIVRNPAEILSVEALRTGLKDEPMKRALLG